MKRISVTLTGTAQQNWPRISRTVPSYSLILFHVSVSLYRSLTGTQEIHERRRYTNEHLTLTRQQTVQTY